MDSFWTARVSRRVSTLCVVIVAIWAVGCSGTATPASTSNDATTTPDTVVVDIKTDTTTPDTTKPDTAVDTIAPDVDEADAADTTIAPDQTADLDDAASDDVVAPDVPHDGQGDTVTPDADADAATDTSAEVAAGKCAVDADCLNYPLGDCMKVGCNVGSGMCQVLFSADGTACELKGQCGGKGTCSKGTCDITSSCVAKACQPAALPCGGSIEWTAGSGASTFSQYKCQTGNFGAGEVAVRLAVDATPAVVKLELTGDALAAGGGLFLLPPVAAGTCNPGQCDAFTNTSITIGLQPGASRVAILDAPAGATGSMKLTVTCESVTYCGDNVCGEGEACGSCPKDCGPCGGACGDGTCSETENCGSCPADCGACKAECIEKSTPSCPGCACEACVCKLDSYCCSSAWDSLCVEECSTDCGGPVCGTTAVCGDNKCSGGETTVTCPNDCLPFSFCGDGKCMGAETCETCSLDCGACAKPTNVCGDGVCNGTEHCATCAKDCGQCSPVCLDSVAPGCPGCACEACVCDKDPLCCSTAWDADCVASCSECSGQPCPDKLACGDGLCAGQETGKTCPKDCGPFVATCGDKSCDGDEATTCPDDCKGPSCAGKCGTSSGQPKPGGGSCYCDAACTGYGDCCTDYPVVCKP